MLRMTRSLAAETGAKNLCLAGGVALNCVANGKVLRDGRFEEHLDAARRGRCRRRAGRCAGRLSLVQRPAARRSNACGDSMKGAYLGPEFSQEEIERRLSAAGAQLHRAWRCELIAECLRRGLGREKAVGWFQGRMEFGPRALGARSILGDARSPTMQSMLNLKVKYPRVLPPFAPSVLREHVADWFELDHDSPYMLLVADVVERRRTPMTEDEQKLFGIEKLNVPRSDIPAVTHVDYSARIQTVHRETNPRYHALICSGSRNAPDVR